MGIILRNTPKNDIFNYFFKLDILKLLLRKFIRAIILNNGFRLPFDMLYICSIHM
jgi:hypothetical protein